MARREVVRLGLFPELDYVQPPNLVEDGTDRTEKRSERFSITNSSPNSYRGWNARGTPSVSSRTASPSVFSSKDVKDDVLAMLRRRYPDRRKHTDSANASAVSWVDRVSEIEMRSRMDGVAGRSRKRKLTDDGRDEDGEDEAPKAKNVRTEIAVSRQESEEVMETGSVVIAHTKVNGSKAQGISTNGTSTSMPRSFGLFEPDDVESEVDNNMETTTSDPVDQFSARTIRDRPRLRPVYGRRMKRGERSVPRIVAAASPLIDQEEEEERKETLAAFRAGQEYERRKIRNWISKPATEKAINPSPLQFPVSRTTAAVTSSLPAVVLVPPSVSSAPLAPTTLFQFVAPPASTSSRPMETPTAASAAPTISLAPVTTVTWSTSLTTPIAAVQPLSISSSTDTATKISDSVGSTFILPTTTAPSTLAMSTLATPASSLSLAPVQSADVSVSVTLPLPLPKQNESSTSMTFRLPTTSATNVTSANATTETAGFNFSAGQPTSTGQFNFAQLDPASTNIFSAVGSAQSLARKKPASSSSLYHLSRRRHR